MSEPEDEQPKDDTRIGEMRLSADFEPNTLIYDANTTTPPRLASSGPLPKPAAPAPKPSAPLERIAHFRILGKIGEGGMGVVFRATDEYLQRLVALKVLGAGDPAAIDRENTQRLLREARAASRINHPNVVTVYAAGEFDGVPFIAMEYVEGRELSKLLGSGGLDTELALDIAGQVAEGLAAAHDQGIVHRDIKPANVLICPDGRVKILDFGLAKPWQSRDPDMQPKIARTADLPDSLDALDFYHTQAGVVWGSLRDMSPEQFMGDAVDARSDVFSLGVVLYQMLTGRLPFTASRPREQLAALLHQQPPPLSQFSLRIPNQVQRIVDRAIARDREIRFSTAQAMAVELRSALQRLRDFGDAEIEDAASGFAAPPRPRDDEPAAAPQDPAPKPGASLSGPLSQQYGVDSVTWFPPGSQFDLVIISPNLYPWAPRGARSVGGGAWGAAVGVAGEVFEVVAVDQQRADLNRYFFIRWPENTIIRRVFDYAPEVADGYYAKTRANAEGSPGGLGSVISNIFGKRRRDP